MSFYYNQQLKRYLVQFMQIFSGMQVEVGANANREAGLIAVPIQYSSMDKVAASILASNTQNKPIRLPAMSASLQSLTRTQQQPGMNQEHAQTYLPAGAFFANEVKTIERLRPSLYTATVDLAIWTSNLDQMFQLLEQILTVFNPSIQIQTSDKTFDWGKITTVELKNVNYQENYPVQANIRMPLANLTFEFDVYLSAPAAIADSFVRDIYLRIGALDEIDYDTMLEDLSEDYVYRKVASADDIVESAEKLDGN